MSNNRIMYSLEDRQVTLTELGEVVTPMPTATWQPVPHYDAFCMLEEAMLARGYQVAETQHVLARDGRMYFGMLALRSWNREYKPTIIMRNDHSKTLAWSVVLGAVSVVACTNLSLFSGDIKLSRKHTPGITYDSPRLLNAALDQLESQQEATEQLIDQYKDTRLSGSQFEHLLVRALRCGVVSGGKASAVVKEWYEPSDPALLDSPSLWRLENAITRTERGNLPNVGRAAARRQLFLEAA